jgi:hypothetical protein
MARLFTLRQIWAHHNSAGHTMEKVSRGVIRDGYTNPLLQAKSELATQGAKAYFTRG